MKDGKTESATEITEGLPPAPPIHDDRVESAEHDLRVNEPSAMQVFFAWEKLRVLYNVILITGLLAKYSGMRGGLGDRWLWDFCFFLFLTNACVSTGPVIEGYLCYFGLPRRAARWISFLVVTAGSLWLVTWW